MNYRCKKCGYTEQPMVHVNPSYPYCHGVFRWAGAAMVCDNGHQYWEGTQFWCNECREWSTDYEVW